MLRVTGITCARGGVPVLADVDFEVAAGNALILRGPNGIGKTTLLRTLAGLQPATAGTVVYPEEQGAYASHADGIKTALIQRVCQIGLSKRGFCVAVTLTQLAALLCSWLFKRDSKNLLDLGLLHQMTQQFPAEIPTGSSDGDSAYAVAQCFRPLRC